MSDEVKNNDWIPVTKQMPDLWQFVWITGEDGRVDVARLERQIDTEELFFNTFYYGILPHNVLAWMLIQNPQPYKDGE